MQMEKSWQGPIPSPEDFEHYKAIDPDLPGRIVAMAERQLVLAENQQSHRIEMEALSVRGMNRRADTGLWMAFVIALVVLGGSFWVISEGHDAAGASIAGLDLIGLVSVFIYGRRDQARQERSHEQPPATGSRRRR